MHRISSRINRLWKCTVLSVFRVLLTEQLVLILGRAGQLNQPMPSIHSSPPNSADGSTTDTHWPAFSEGSLTKSTGKRGTPRVVISDPSDNYPSCWWLAWLTDSVNHDISKRIWYWRAAFLFECYLFFEKKVLFSCFSIKSWLISILHIYVCWV